MIAPGKFYPRERKATTRERQFRADRLRMQEERAERIAACVDMPNPETHVDLEHHFRAIKRQLRGWGR